MYSMLDKKALEDALFQTMSEAVAKEL